MVAVLIVLHDVAFGGLVSSRHVDLLSHRVPYFCFLGRSLSGGHVPAWNPYALGGAPFAADPQSGWMYLPVMALFMSMPCEAATRWFIVLLPILTGLGTYAFLRAEEVSPPGATLGGSVAALVIAGSRLVLFLPFVGTIAWMTVSLAGAARYWRAESWPSRLGWVAVAALGWGQAVSAHFSNGIILATAALATHALVHVRRHPLRAWLGMGALLLLALPAVNLAILLPRLAFVSQSALGLGYDQLQKLTVKLTGAAGRAINPRLSVPASWLLVFAASPGAYLGAAPLALVLTAWRRATHRAFFVWCAAFASVSLLLSLRVVATTLARVGPGLPGMDVYLRAPWRFRYGVLFALPLLAALGFEALRATSQVVRRVAVLAAGLSAWIVVSLVRGIDLAHVTLLVGGGSVALALVALSAFRPLVLGLLPALVAVELVANGLLGQGYRGAPLPMSIRGTGAGDPFSFLAEQGVRLSEYFHEDATVRALRGVDGRFATFLPTRAAGSKNGYLLLQRPEDWGLMANQRSMLFGLEDAQGYNPVQLRRYWILVRTANRTPMNINAAFFSAIPAPVADVLQITAVVSRAGQPPVPGVREIRGESPWSVYVMPSRPPRASLVTEWSQARSEDEALRWVLEGRAVGSDTAVLEADPGIPEDGGPASGDASYVWLGPQWARVLVSTDRPALVVVRNVFDRHWSATVDGAAAELLPADYLIQAVPVPAGRHTVILRYDDPWVGYGLAGSGAFLGALFGLAILASRRGRPARAPGTEVGQTQEENVASRTAAARSRLAGRAASPDPPRHERDPP